jgi:hypothetical protein
VGAIVTHVELPNSKSVAELIMDNDILFEGLNSTYSEWLRKYGDSSAAVGIPKDNQGIRFDSISRHIPVNEAGSYADYGCGLAHQLTYFRAKGYQNLSYTGVEVNLDFLKACEEKYPRDSFLTRDNFFGSDNQYDYVGAVGVFNLIYVNDSHQIEFVKEEISKLWAKTNKVLFLNFMTNDVDFKQVSAYHQDLSDLYLFARKNFSKSLFIDSTYLPYEFTIGIFR